MALSIPKSLEAEHLELHIELAEIRKMGGKTANALEHLVDVMHHHFVYEEDVAMPPLSLLAKLANDEEVEDVDEAIKLSDKLRDNYDRMLAEHAKIIKAAENLAEVALQENKKRAIDFAESLKEHAQVEEEVIYPASLLVGKYLKEKYSNKAAK